MTRFSLLDLVPVREGDSVSTALANAANLAAHAEALGYHRYWVAEHHGMPGIASAATSVVLAHIGHATSTIRIGAGGIMLPNHAPLLIAEQFGTLAALFPNRIDLGLGRAPGSDQRVAQAIRRNLAGGADQFPRDVMELQAYFAGDARLGIEATPGAGEDVPLWILGSSLYGAQLAAALGLPYAFASHFAPGALDEAIAIYRRDFRPSAQLKYPYVMAGYNVFAADSMEEAQLLASSMQQAFVRLRTGQPGKLQPPVEGYYDSLPPQAQAMLSDVLSVSSIGTQAHVERDIAAFLRRTQADELILTGQIHDVQARKHSFAIAMAAAQALTAREPA
ncbi:MAG: LLM class flavin-dependent oxidoreductase [Pseudomonadota bacterium]|uniref:Luciferase-like monooxygenase n=1 Tax=Sphingobium xenophagum TaxID=121428 RepID=A0A249MTR7_SPHXE|nr:MULTISPECIES: LLM class flavin-dependent oxidoreductase [Sphingobium]ASY44682.1 luciferase family oxidoreductase [Sphingobium xenophagum]OUC53862.1 alkane 1-monooxygenase [Sphingobium sp. GW456-12-10-14-TSB1]QWT14980.1 LLM class flavin-dependent oxidoreductase [Sphingobium xenophagum]|tara:strand:+ start:2009 stop:3013 length:1005 start_codon:yes stop_codon:yes gene_type:complete